MTDGAASGSGTATGSAASTAAGTVMGAGDAGAAGFTRSAAFEKARQAEVIARVEAAGVTDEQGFPLHIRLQRPVDAVIASAFSDEPLLETDRALFCRNPEPLLNALSQVASAVDASRLFLAVRDADAEVLSAYAQVRRRFPAVTLFPVEDAYPAADARVLTQLVLGHQTPVGARPEDVGALVLSMSVLHAVSEALKQRPVTHVYVQVCGEVGRPGIYKVPLGTSFDSLLSLAGGALKPTTARIVGGALKGKVLNGQPGSDGAVTQTTRSLLVLPSDQGVVERMQLPPEQMLQRAASICMGCRACTDRCPSHLQGYAIQPHLLMRGMTLRRDDQAEVVTGASACLGCHLCDALCPGGLSPGRLYGAVAEVLKARGQAGLPAIPPKTPHALFAERQVGREWLIDRLGLRAYADAQTPAPVRGKAGWQGVPVDEKALVPEVSLLLKGVEPVLAAGDKVTAGQRVASPSAGTVGAHLHSPLTGWIRSIRADRMTIVAESV